MTAKSEKERRNQIKKAYLKAEREKIFETLPIPLEMLQNCFRFLERRLPEYGCDRTLKLTLQFITENNLPEDDLIEWFAGNGGLCDREVMGNVEGQING